jgi:hypothetical protein
MIEVIDPNTKRVVARRTVPLWIVAALPGLRAAAYTIDNNGVPHIEIITLSLTGR